LEQVCLPLIQFFFDKAQPLDLNGKFERINRFDKFRSDNTPLWHAISCCSADVVEFLVHNGARVEDEHVACAARWLEIFSHHAHPDQNVSNLREIIKVLVLKGGADINFDSKTYGLPIAYIISAEDYDLFELFFSKNLVNVDVAFTWDNKRRTKQFSSLLECALAVQKDRKNDVRDTLPYNTQSIASLLCLKSKEKERAYTLISSDLVKQEDVDTIISIGREKPAIPVPIKNDGQPELCIIGRTPCLLP
jgi:ankyrin repeat protein